MDRIRRACLLISVFLAFIFLSSPVLAQQDNGNVVNTGGGFKTTMFAPTKGVMTSVSDYARPDSYAAVLDNLQMLKRGIWTSYGIGHAKHRAGQFNSGAEFTAIDAYHDGSDIDMLCQVGDKIYLYDISATTETQKYTGLSTSARGMFKTFTNDMTIYANGNIDPLKYTGTGNFSALTGWPVTINSVTFEEPKYLETFAGRMAFAGFADHPNTVLLSDFGNAETYTTSSPQLATDAGFIELPAQLGPINGLRLFRLDNLSSQPVLVVGCANGVALIEGSDATDFDGKEVTREYGLLSNNTWVQLGNDLYFMATDGIRRFSTSAGYSTLAGTAVTYHMQDLYNQVNTSEVEQAFAVHHSETQEVIWFFPIGSDTECKNGIVLNYNSRKLKDVADEGETNTIKYPIFSTRSGVEFTAGKEIDGTAFYGTDDGYLMEGYNGNTYDGTAFTWTYLSPMLGGPTPANSISNRQFLLLLDGADQKFDVEAYTVHQKQGGDTSCAQRYTKTVDITSSSLTNLGTWASGTTTSYPKIVEFSSMGVGRYWKIRLTGDASDEMVNFVGIQAIFKVGSWRQ